MEKILIVVDIQKDFVDGSLGTNEAVRIVDNAVRKIKSHDGKIYVTFDTHEDNYLNTSEGKNLPVSHCIKGTEGHALDTKIINALINKDWVAVEKPTFGSTELPTLIKNNHGTDIEIDLIGLCTDICVVSNALILKALYPDTEITVDASCCACVTPESHKAALLTMKMCQINVVGE